MSDVQYDRRRHFELLALPHLNAAHDLARWLARNGPDSDEVARDVVQIAYMRAFRYFDSFRGGDPLVWIRTIVLNSFATWHEQNRSTRLAFVGNVLKDSTGIDEPLWGSRPIDPESLLIEKTNKRRLADLLQQLPTDLREPLLLREMKELSYKEIASAMDIPIGTVMSRLARAKAALRRLWLET